MKQVEVKSRKTTTKYGQELDWKIFQEKRKALENENRRMRRSFAIRMEERLRVEPKNDIAITISRDRRRKRHLQAIREISKEKMSLNAFKTFMGTHHDQNHVVIPMGVFKTLDRIKADL